MADKALKMNDDGQYELTAVIDAAAFLKAVDRVYRRENKNINIQGFRKGKTPRAVIERMYGETFFYDDAINDLLPDLFEKTLNESGILMIGKPGVDVKEVGRENGVTVVFTVKPRPELSVGAYKGIAGTRTVHTVKDAEIDAEMDRLREQGSRIVAVEDRAAEDGDITVIDFEGFVDGVAFAGGKGEGHELTLGSGQFIPGFEEQVAGHTAGESFDVTVTFPEEYGAEELAGKTAVFKVRLHEIRRKELPDIDDEFAKDVSEFDTLQELRADIASKKQAEHDDRAKAELENQLVDAVAETLEGEIPPGMIDDRMDEMARDFDYRLHSQGLDMQTYLKYTGSDLPAFRESFREQAVKFVKTRLTLEAVARAEKIEILDEDREAEYARLSKSYGVDIERAREIVPVREMEEDIKVGKAIDVIRDNAKIKDEKPAKPAAKKTARPKTETAQKAEETTAE